MKELVVERLYKQNFKINIYFESGCASKFRKNNLALVYHCPYFQVLEYQKRQLVELKSNLP